MPSAKPLVGQPRARPSPKAWTACANASRNTSKLGARFAKWRAVIDIAKDIPTYNCVNANAQALARYAALAQENGIVPIVEPEVLMDGDHDVECALRDRSQLGSCRNCVQPAFLSRV